MDPWRTDRSNRRRNQNLLDEATKVSLVLVSDVEV
jgi:hypothetical protein